MAKQTATSEENTVRFDTDPRIVMSAADSESVARGKPYTPTDLSLLRAGTHPYMVFA